MIGRGFTTSPLLQARGRARIGPTGKEGYRDNVAHPALSIVIPAYNEHARIEGTLERVMACVQDRGWDAEVLVVDDGSTDETVAIVQHWMEKHDRLHLVKNPGNRGKGYSVRNGLLQAAGDIVMFTDADLSSPMEEAERLMAAIDAGADVRGYFHWTLVDNFEWAEGWSARFGLFALEPRTQQRTLRPSGELYAEICRSHGAAPNSRG